MDNIIHVDFAKRNAQRKADARLGKLERVVGVNSDGMIVFTMGIFVGALVVIAIATLFQ